MTVTDPETRRTLLAALYAAYEKLAAKFHFACREGCCTCCTQSVTLTTLEGSEIIRFLQKTNRGVPPVLPAERCRPNYTANGYARLFLERRGDMDSEDEPWNFAPCVFLSEKKCAIYPVRPFDCRCLLSLRNCALSGAAEIFPALLTVNSMGRQILEHIDHPGFWGNIYDILDSLHIKTDGVFAGAQGQALSAGTTRNFSLLPTEKISGFLIPPEDRNLAAKFQALLSAEHPSFSRLLPEAGAQRNESR